MSKFLMGAAALCAVAGSASAQVRITEWMYSGALGEWIEFTNVGSVSVDVSNWSFDDDSQTPGVFSFGAIGVLTPGESMVITEADASAFRTEWSIDPSVKVLGGYTNNLGRNDEINLFDAANALVDRLTYGDQNYAGSIRTQNVSGNPLAGALGANDPYQWVLASVGDAYASYTSVGGDVGNPGIFAPTPGAGALALAGLLGLRRRRA